MVANKYVEEGMDVCTQFMKYGRDLNHNVVEYNHPIIPSSEKRSPEFASNIDVPFFSSLLYI